MTASYSANPQDSLPKNIALSPYGYWPRTKWCRFREVFRYRLRCWLRFISFFSLIFHCPHDYF